MSARSTLGLLTSAACYAMVTAWSFGMADAARATDIRFTAGEYSSHTRPFFEQVAKDYEALHPDVHVHIEVVPWDGYLQKLTTDVNGGTPPDLSIIATIWLPDFASQGIIEPLDPYLSPGMKAAFIPSFFAPSTIDGKLMGVPAAASARAMMVNLDLLKQAGVEPPKTWDDLHEVAKKVSALPGVYGFGLQGKEVETDTYFYYALWGFGGDILTNGKSGLGSPQSIEAATFYKTMVDEKLTQPSPTGSARDDVFTLFKRGKLGVIFTYPMIVPQIKAEAPNLHFAVLPFPHKGDLVTLGVTDVMMLYSASKVKKEAWDFAQFTYQDKYRSKFDRDEGLLPVTKSVVAEDYYQKNPDVSTFAQGLNYARFVPTIPDWAEFADITSRALQTIYLGQATPAAAMTDAAKQIDAIRAK